MTRRMALEGGCGRTAVSRMNSVRGYDRTRIARITMADYLAELQSEKEAGNMNGGETRGCSSRSALLTSSDPNTVFSSKYPVYNQLGHELCVQYQIHEVEIANELERISNTANGRRSGVRLSTEVPMESCRPTLVEADAHEGMDFRPSHAGRYGSVYSSRGTTSVPPSQMSSARPSVFSIYRESQAPSESRARYTELSVPPPVVHPERVADDTSPRKRRRDEGLEGTSGIGAAENITERALRVCRRESTSPPPTPSALPPPTVPAPPAPAPLTYPAMITGTAYDARAGIVPLSAVADKAEQNFEALCQQQLTRNVLTLAHDESAPTLEANTMVSFGGETYHLLYRVADTDVFKAVKGCPSPDADAKTVPEVLVYRWHGGRSRRESFRAALGLQACAPGALVSGFEYQDAGFTLVHLPLPYRAMPLHLLQLNDEGFWPCLELLLKMVSTFLSRRVVHGSLDGLSHVWLGMPEEGVWNDYPPVLFPVHWERCADFNMFADRHVGRTVALQLDDGASALVAEGGTPLTNLELRNGTDLRTAVHEALQWRGARVLSGEMYRSLQQLLLRATEPTHPAASLVLQLHKLICSIPVDGAEAQAALSRAHRDSLLKWSLQSASG